MLPRAPTQTLAPVHTLERAAEMGALAAPRADALHWDDEPALHCLVYLAGGLQRLQLLLLVGTRQPVQANLPALVAELLAAPIGVVIRPGSLGEESAAVLARSSLGAEPDP